MASAKSSNLLMKVYQFEESGAKCLLLKPSQDNRVEGEIYSRIIPSRKCKIIHETDNICKIVYNSENFELGDKYNYIDFKDLEEYLKGKINLSYSSMNNYYLCAFRFYIENVLKLDPFTDTFAAFLGNLFHDCLSKMYEDGFDLKSNYEAY